MAKALVVVESPAKAKTINKYLGRDYKVIASMGHVRDLPKSKLGVDIEEGFEPSYEVIASRKKVLKDLKDGAKDAEEIFIATDPVTAATSPRGRLIYGFGIGLLIYVIRRWGSYADGVAFAVLLMNMAAPAIDYVTRPRIVGHPKRRRSRD